MAGMTTAFALLAVGLASIGLYAVLANGVAARRKEIGIRMALGAGRRAVIRLVVFQSVRLVLTGTVVGLVVSIGASGVLAARLYGVNPRAVWVYVTVAAVFLLVGLAASLAPALRASRIAPLAAMR
jgi:ABC-type antimicrobial peptide transport system permease subunit